MAFIEVGDIEWESLAENELGERRFKCRNFEQSFQVELFRLLSQIYCIEIF
uniref:Uncharacterized protein n=1 Tax=Parascaris equorum TaxID=6256 RepID=A0A914SJK4_PAREQ